MSTTVPPSTAGTGGPLKLSKKDYRTDQEVRWCPGCGDYGILNWVQQAFSEMGKDRDQVAIVSGIGCSSRFPYYMVDVWVATGDGDALSIGGNHFIHLLRRNVGVKVLMFNNRIYGLTKGQYSPTSEQGKVTKSTPLGSLDMPFNPLSVAIGCGATFVARAVDVLGPHLSGIIKAAAAHDGTAFVEIFQNCNIFNDGAFEAVISKEVRDDMLIDVQHGKPLVFGKSKDRGLVWDRTGFRVMKVGDVDDAGKTVTQEDFVVWDAHVPNPGLAFALAQLREGIDPTPIGVIRDVPGHRPYERLVHEQIAFARQKRPDRSLEQLLYAGETWQVT
jgi:2-oxoglutarate ferredoxin oxidoreductase subunit beta